MCPGVDVRVNHLQTLNTLLRCLTASYSHFYTYIIQFCIHSRHVKTPGTHQSAAEAEASRAPHSTGLLLRSEM